MTWCHTNAVNLLSRVMLIATAVALAQARPDYPVASAYTCGFAKSTSGII